MGALAPDYWANSAGQGYGGKTVVPVNNPVYKPASVPYSTTSTASAVRTALSSATKAYSSNKVAIAINLVTTAYEAVSSLISTLSEADRIMAQNDLDALASQKRELELQKEAGQMTQQKQDELEDYLKRQQDAVPANAGTNLLSVLTNNGISLVTSIGTITSTFGEKFDTLNECMYSFLKYMDTVTTFMEKSYDLSKSNIDEAKKDKEATTEVGDTKMTASEIEVQKNLAMMKAYQFKTSALNNTVLEATTVLGMTPLQIEASKNSYIVEANEFAKSPIPMAILESDSVVGMSPREIEVSHRSNEVEARVYSRTPTQVKDIDENVLFDIAPREARLVNDATMAIKTTDLNNDHLEQEDIDIVSPFDISSIYGFKDCDSVCKALIDQFKDSAL